MRAQIALVISLLLVIMATPVFGQSASPSPGASPVPAVDCATGAAASSEDQAPTSCVVSPPADLTSPEVVAKLRQTARQKHPKANYDKVAKDVLRYFKTHPEIVVTPRKGASEGSPRKLLRACKRDLARESLKACPAMIYALYYAYLVAGDGEVLDLAGRFIGATRKRQPKRYSKIVVRSADTVVEENLELFRVPTDLPSVTDDEHVTVVLFDAGPWPKKVARAIAQLFGFETAEGEATLANLPAILWNDLTMAEAEAIRRLVEGAGGTIGMTDAVARRTLSSSDLAAPASAEPASEPSTDP